ncbi:hypothetical protein [Variovorax paradoxus]|uniref:hypothetical protein n=1 Tax=Variovorax paradoxus TaxID=34073 RepID=UPI0028660F22|nr:hypothetical protein [Variovorax paradoxus]MDR6453470.1 hypothetical protein [Variovorax paradoxus]
MAKRKVFIKTDLTTPGVEYVRSPTGAIVIPLEAIPPAITTIRFGNRAAGGDRFDFGRWYGAAIDQIVFACQKQIERFMDKQDGEISLETLNTYCFQGLKNFFNYLTALSTALRRELTLESIDRSLIDGYLQFLQDAGISTLTQKNRYSSTKSVLNALSRRGLIRVVHAGDSATFPSNPFPGVHKKIRGEKPMSKRERKEFSVAVKTAVMPIFSDEVVLTSELLSYALLVIALHTGRNTWPLLEMTPDCLRSHPKDNTLFLVLYKRRGHSNSKVALKADREGELGIESMPTVRPTVAALIRRVIELSEPLRADAPEHMKDRVWLYRTQSPVKGNAAGTLSYLTVDTLARSTRLLVKRCHLTDTDGKPMRVNVSRLRKTFINRIYEILDGDIAATAVAAGDSVEVTSISYLRPGEDSQKNWKFMGIALVDELLTNTIGATERTPVGRCSDVRDGEYAPKRDGSICMSFFNCLRCRNYVVTADDLYRLFSFYWRILLERTRMIRGRWKHQFSHIIRLIDHDVIQAGIAQGVFKKEQVDSERERARLNPHPFWRSSTIVADIEGLAR